MPEYDDFTPATWATHDNFKSARAAYDAHVGRSYDDAIKKNIKPSDLVPDSIETDSTAPIVILCDQTGSMGQWPATIFSKLPYLDNEAKFYFGDDYQIAFGAFGDINPRGAEKYPVQIRPFATGKDLEKKLKELVIEGGGGCQVHESSEMAMLYVDQNIHTPNATKPLLIIITDEKSYDVISPEDAESYCKCKLEKRMTTKELVEKLKQKWSIYLVRKPYDSGYGDSEGTRDRQIREHWEKLLGADHIALLPDAARVVDVIFGIFAKETGKEEEFKKELKDRQLKDVGGDRKVEIVLKSLNTIHSRARGRLPHKKGASKLLAGPPSVSRRRSGGTATKASKSLLDD